ncbi:MAG: sigma-54-dependent Fis family transcriptional regulator [Deltaproteobacteria bacterium]|nr:sigma-54-dependent Fis family transcriptional regulator [Deltaproteobacteria bacterium]
MKTKAILVVDDDSSMRMVLSEFMEDRGYRIETAENGADALKRFQEGAFDVVVTDMKMPGGGGMEVLRGIKKIASEIPVVVMTAYGTVNTAVEAMKEGAEDFIMKPFAMDHLEAVIAGVSTEQGGGRRDAAGRDPRGSLSDGKRVVTQDKAMLTLLELLKGVSRSRSSVLIQGESGTGKELLARHIHRHSDRAHMPFVGINCAAIPHNLLESEMFGHERGAFTGASQRRLGKFELASGGTLLLDEISEMDMQLQAKLLRVIQESEVDRLGGGGPVPVDVRIVATTNADLKRCVEDKKFRADLYYRLNVIPVKVPSLRERRGDIPLLSEYFLEKYSGLAGRTKPEISREAARALENHHWPGNVRELENVIERAVLLSGGGPVLPEHLRLEEEGAEGGQPAATAVELAVAQGTTLREMEKNLIFKTLERENGNRTRASEILGVSVRTIRNKLNEYKNETDDEGRGPRIGR